MSNERNREVIIFNRFGVSFALSLGMLIHAIVLILVGALHAAEFGPATEAVRQTIDQVLAIMEDQELKSPERAVERRAKLEEVIGQRFDYEEMGKRTLAAHWKKMDSSQQKEFVTLFQSFLSNSYAGNIDGYSGQKVEYVKERHKGNFAEVQTKVISSKAELPLDYRLLKKNGEYRVYDVVIDGVSLVKNYRGQFSRIIKSSSYDGLIEKLRTKANQFSKPK
jgi:phospholipid transport system substrate-binding protein